MKLGFSSLGCPGDNVDELLVRAQKLGVSCLELRTVRGTVSLWDLPEFSTAALPETAKRFSEAGIAPVVIGTSGSFASGNILERNERLSMLKRYCEIAQGLGCPYLRVFGGPIPDGMTRDQVIYNDLAGYSRACELAAPYHVQLLFETHDDFSRSDDVLSLVEGLRGKAGVIWDVLHPYRFGESPAETWRKLRPYVKHVHIKDSLNFTEKDFDIASIGTGRVPLREIVQMLATDGYDGCLCYEWEKHWHPEIASADEEFPKFVQWMRQQ